jgi:hypothetical protein
MNWINQDWEHEHFKDEMYALERQMMESEWRDMEMKKFGKIKILINKRKHENKKSLPFRRNHKKRIFFRSALSLELNKI